MTETADRFKNRAAALAWLQEKGQISAGTFSNYCSAGFVDISGRRFPLVVAADKTMSKFQISEFANAYFQKMAPSLSVEDYSDQRAKAEMDISQAKARIERVKADDVERELDHKWHLRADHERDMAAYAGLIQDALRHRVYLDHYELLLACGGDHSRASEFAHALQDFCDRALNDVSEYKELTVEFELPEGAEDDD